MLSSKTHLKINKQIVYLCILQTKSIWSTPDKLMSSIERPFSSGLVSSNSKRKMFVSFRGYTFLHVHYRVYMVSVCVFFSQLDIDI